MIKKPRFLDKVAKQLRALGSNDNGGSDRGLAPVHEHE